MAASARVTVYAAQALAAARKLSRDDRLKIAHEIADEARATAPIDTGTFMGSIRVQVGGNDTVSVINDDEVAGYVEYGTSNTPAHATMTNAARQFGTYTGMTPRR